MNKPRAVVLELPTRVLLACFLLSLLGKAADPFSFEQTIDTGTTGFGQRLLNQVYQIIEGQSLLAQGQDHALLLLVKGRLYIEWTAALVFGRGALLPAMNRA